jgi:hypothetical protein
MTIVTCFVSDRRDLYLPKCMKSYNEHVAPLDHTLWHLVDDHEHQLGMAGAVQAAWDWALSTGADFLLHVEEDFLFHRPVPVEDLITILDNNPQLAQVVLKRQPWSPEEHQAGGIPQLYPDRYDDRECHGIKWLETNWLFSLNPCLIPRRVLELGWPSGPIGVGNESGMTEKLVDKGYSFGLYGTREDDPMCIHVGAMRGEGWRL